MSPGAPAPADDARPAARTARALESDAARDVALVTLVAGVVLAVAIGDATCAVPQVAASLVQLVARPGARTFAPSMRWLLVLAGVGYAAGLPGDAVRTLGRFLSAMSALTLVEGRPGRERGFLLLLALAQLGLGAALLPGLPIFAVLVAMVLLLHRALSSTHRARGALFAVERGGPVRLAGDPRLAGRGARRGALAVLGLGAALFPLLPRVDTPIFALRAPRSGGGGGVGDEIRLRALAAIGDLDVVVGRATPLDAGAETLPPYLRATTYDVFDGRGWSTGSARAPTTSPDPDGRFDFPHAPSVDSGARWRLEIGADAAERLPLPEGANAVIFAAPLPDWLRYDEASGVLRIGVPPSARWLDVRVESPPGRISPAGPNVRPAARHLDLPESVRADLTPLVREAIAGIAPGRATARRLTEWIRGRCAYALDGAPGGPRPMQEFLGSTRRGHCEYFASALAVCLRCADVPARVVGGWMPTRWNDVGGFWALRGRDAHAWVEAYIEGEGWSRFDAVPAGARPADPYRGVLGYFSRLRDAAEQLWSAHVLGFDRREQADLLAAIGEAVHRGRNALPARAPAIAGGVASGLGLTLLVLATLRRRRGAHGHKLLNTNKCEVEFYRRALRLIRRRGLAMRSTESPLGLLERAGGALSADGCAAFSDLTAAFEVVRYGAGREPDRSRISSWMGRMTAMEKAR